MTKTRTVGRDFTIRFDNRRFQIPKTLARGIRPCTGPVFLDKWAA